MGVIQEASSAISTIINKFVPDAKDRLEAELLVAKQMHELDKAQAEINKVEAASTDPFTSRWRPFIGWVCGCSFAYAVIGNDLMNWAFDLIALWGRAIPHVPEPDATLTFELLLALLGLGGYRTFEKVRGIK